MHLLPSKKKGKEECVLYVKAKFKYELYMRSTMAASADRTPMRETPRLPFSLKELVHTTGIYRKRRMQATLQQCGHSTTRENSIDKS